MDELEISGKRYISTRRAAREHGYHSDYMGQLVRGKKVAGQKVGRSWYIEEESLKVYLGKAPAPVQKPEPEPQPVVEPVAIAEAAPEGEPEIEPQEERVPEPQTVQEAGEPAAEEKAAEPSEEPAAAAAEEEKVATVEIKKEVEPEPAPVEEESTRIKIHKPEPARPAQESGGLRYIADDLPVIPIVTRAPQMQEHVAEPAALKQGARQKFPYISLSVVAVIAVVGAVFVSNFVSLRIVSEEGKAATVNYAIHW